MKNVAAFMEKHYNRASDCPFYRYYEGLQEESMRRKRFAAVLLSGVMAASLLAGCGGVNKEAAVAVLDGEEVSLGLANFAARLQQASYDDFYVSYFGEGVWSSDMSGNGTTMEDSTKTNALESVENMLVLQKHMSEYGVELTEEEKNTIADTAASFMEANSKEALNALGATSEIVEEYLTLMTIENKMHTAMIADADTNVSDEEANTSAYSYVRISKQTYTDADGKSAEYTEDELTKLAETTKEFVAAAKEDTLEMAAESYEYTVSTGTFTKEDESLNEAVLNALQGLKEGEVSDVIDTDTNYYVVRLDKETDADATEETRQSIISQRQSDLYSEVLDGWKEEHEWTVDEKVWKTVTFDNLFTTIVPSTETETPEDVESTQS